MTSTLEKINSDYLKNKLSAYGFKYHSGNIHRLSENVFKFTIHNILPKGENGQLDGHYTFYVNYKTFEYLVYKSSGYGSLTYTTKSDNESWVNDLNEIEFKYLESLIASKLLGAYFYDSEAPNSKGDNLFPDTNNKCSLICDHRGYVWVDLIPEKRSEKDLNALSILDKSFKQKIVKSIKLGKIEEVTRYKKTYQFNTNLTSKKNKIVEKQLNGIKYLLPIYVVLDNNVTETYYLYRDLTPIYYNYFNILDSNYNRLIEYDQHYSGKPSNVIKMLPDFIKSL